MTYSCQTCAQEQHRHALTSPCDVKLTSLVMGPFTHLSDTSYAFKTHHCSKQRAANLMLKTHVVHMHKVVTVKQAANRRHGAHGGGVGHLEVAVC